MKQINARKTLLLTLAGLSLALGVYSQLPDKLPGKKPTAEAQVKNDDHIEDLISLYQHNQWSRCIRKAPAYIKNDKHRREARWILARSYVACNQAELALPLAEDALASEPRSLDLLGLKVDVLQRLHRNQEALKVCDQAFALKGDKWELHTAAGQLLLDEGQLDRAEAELALALQKLPPEKPFEKALILDATAQISAARGDRKRAVTGFNQALMLDPRGSGGMIQAHLAAALAAGGEDKKAKQYARVAALLGYKPEQNNQPLSVCLSKSFSPDQGRLKHRLDTRHFIIFANGGGSELHKFGQDAELFLSFLDANVCPITSQYPICIYAWDNCKQHQQYIADKTERRISTNNLGQTSEKFNLISTCGFAYRSTLFHQLAHNALLDSGLRFYPWAREGVPRALETVYGYRDGDHVVLYAGFESPLMVRLLPADFKKWQLADIISKTPINHTAEAQALAGSFLAERGELQHYLALGRAQTIGGYETYFEAAFDQTAKELEPLWQNYIRSVTLRRELISTYPTSSILPDKRAFRAFILKHKISLAGHAPRSLPIALTQGTERDSAGGP